MLSKKEKGEGVEQTYSTPKKLSENFGFKGCQETLIRDQFITNMSTTSIQRHLFRETKEQ